MSWQYVNNGDTVQVEDQTSLSVKVTPASGYKANSIGFTDNSNSYTVQGGSATFCINSSDATVGNELYQFKASSFITRAEAATIINRMFDVTTRKTGIAH